MKIGMFVFATAETMDTAVLAKKAEQVGFESFWVPEHAIIPVNTTSPFPGSPDGVIPGHYGRIVDPFIALARAAAVTTTIMLGTAICLVPERNPLLLAKEVATLDYFSGGRFIFGIGSGWLKEETEILGGDFPRRWTQTRESIMAMKELWTKDESEHHGKYYDFPPVRYFPKPLQKPHPPIFLGSMSNQRVFKRIVEWGDGWMPPLRSVEEITRGRATLDELAKRAGRDPKSIQIMAFGTQGQFDDREAIERMEEAGVDRVSVWLRHRPGDDALAEIEAMAGRVL